MASRHSVTAFLLPGRLMIKDCFRRPAVALDRYACIVISLVFVGITLFLAGLALQMTETALRLQTMLYATYMFISGIAILVPVEIMHLAKREISRNNA